MNERIDRELAAQLERLADLEDGDGWTDDEITGAQLVLVETASWLRGHRPPTSWEEAWQRINERRDAGRLRGSGLGR